MVLDILAWMIVAAVALYGYFLFKENRNDD